jgi:protein LTV1
MMDDFLDNYEMLGRKLKPKLEGETGLGTLATVRQALGKDDRIKIAYDVDNQSDDDADLLDEEDQKERWDCETILSECLLSLPPQVFTN